MRWRADTGCRGEIGYELNDWSFVCAGQRTASRQKTKAIRTCPSVPTFLAFFWLSLHSTWPFIVENGPPTAQNV